MSADHGYTLNRLALLQRASLIEACERFTVETGGSHHRCSECDQSYDAHVAAALLHRICRGCLHGDQDDRDAVVWCTNQASWARYKALPPTEGCSKWEPKA